MEGLAIAGVVLLIVLWATRRSGSGAQVSANHPGGHTVTSVARPQQQTQQTVSACPVAPVVCIPQPVVSSSPLTATQKVIGTIPSDIGPVPIVADSTTTGNLLNVAQVWLGGVSHFVATYRDGSQMEVDAGTKVIGPWPLPSAT